MSQNRPVRIHLPEINGRQLCGYDIQGHTSTPDEALQIPMCGACLFMLGALWDFSVHLSGEVSPPDLRPAESLALLRQTKWAEFMERFEVGEHDRWWFEEEKEPGA